MLQSNLCSANYFKTMINNVTDDSVEVHIRTISNKQSNHPIVKLKRWHVT